MADWQKIKTEYITTNTSYRKLAEKYGLHRNAIANKAKQENWVSQKCVFGDMVVTEAVSKACDTKSDRAANLISVADKLLAKVQSLLDSDEDILIDTQSLKHLSGVLKDIKDIQMIKSDIDIREQEARIKNLEKQAESDETTKDIKVTIVGELDEYSK